MVKRIVAAMVTLAVCLAVGAPVAAQSRSDTMSLNFVQQQTTATPADQPVLLASQTGMNIAAGAGYASPTIDIRAYNSYLLFIRAEAGTYLDTDTIQIELDFFTTPAGVPGLAGRHYHDKYIIFKTDAPGSSRFELTDLAHGPYMTMNIYNNQLVARTFNLTFELWGSYRSLPATWLRTAPDGILAEQRFAAMAPAAVQSMNAFLGYGRGIASLLSGAGGGATMEIIYGNATARDVLVAGAANTRVTKEIIMPKWQPRVTITNNGAGVSTIDWHIFQQGYPQ